MDYTRYLNLWDNKADNNVSLHLAYPLQDTSFSHSFKRAALIQSKHGPDLAKYSGEIV